MLFKTEAVVLRKNKITDADVILTLFTRKYGKIRAVAKGGRKPKTRLSPSSHIFVYGDFIINKGKNLDKVSSVDIKESFYNIREDLTKLAYASYFAELCDAVIVEGVTNNRLFDTLIKGLYLITYRDQGYDLIKIAFQLQLLDFSGFRPEIKKCVNCGGVKFNKINFNIHQGGIICDNCYSRYDDSMLVNSMIIKVMNYILKTDITTVSKLKLNPSIIKRLERIIDKYIEIHLERKNFKSLEFLRTLEQNLS